MAGPRHAHAFDEVSTLPTQAEPRDGATTTTYNPDGSVLRITGYRDVGKTTVWWVETWAYDSSGQILSIVLDSYDDAGATVVDTETVTFDYAADGSLVGESNA